MKKSFKIFTSAILALIFVMFSACNNIELNNLNSLFNEAKKSGYSGTIEEFSQIIDGSYPLSAYDIAVKNGFTGTEIEWLKSLIGKSAYELALENGFEGSLTDWLLSLKGEQGLTGQQGEQGIQGLSAYQIAVLNGYTGSEADWLLSLKGEQGEQGLQGLTGEKGEQGEQGIQGLSAYQIAVLNGYTGSEADWLLSLKGEQGEQGLQGLTGEKGEQGEQGLSAYQLAVLNGYTGSQEQWLLSLTGNESTQTQLSDIVQFAMPSIVEVNSPSSRATGIIITSDGYVLTNAHCVTYKDGEQYKVLPNIVTKFKGLETTHAMTVIHFDIDKDLAIIKFNNNPQNLVPATLGNSDSVVIGDSAFVIGNALGYGLGVTAGCISDDLKVLISSGGYIDLLQTDAAVNPGNSGGALFNYNGEVIGVITFKLITSALGHDVYAENMNFAISINYAKAYINSLPQNIII